MIEPKVTAASGSMVAHLNSTEPRPVLDRGNMPGPTGTPTNVTEPLTRNHLAALIAANSTFLFDVPSDSEPSRCTTCKRTSSEAEISIPLSICSRCLSAYYCSWRCQTADWEVHKKICWEPIPVLWFANSHKIVDAAAWLASLSRLACYEVLIDVYRLRLYDKYQFVVGVEGFNWNPARDFREYLEKAAKQGILPDWWMGDPVAHLRVCIKMGMQDGRACVLNVTGKGDMVEKYGYDDVVMQLRAVADIVYGHKVKPVAGPGRLKRLCLRYIYVEGTGKWKLDDSVLRQYLGIPG